MALIDAHGAKTFSLGTIQFTALVAPSRGSIDNSVWRVAVAAGTAAAGSHQVTREEVFVALSGAADVLLDGHALTLRAGSALIVPAHTDFSLSNSGPEAFEAVVVLPVGGKAVVEGQPPFIPPWAQ